MCVCVCVRGWGVVEGGIDGGREGGWGQREKRARLNEGEKWEGWKRQRKKKCFGDGATEESNHE